MKFRHKIGDTVYKCITWYGNRNNPKMPESDMHGIFDRGRIIDRFDNPIGKTPKYQVEWKHTGFTLWEFETEVYSKPQDCPSRYVSIKEIHPYALTFPVSIELNNVNRKSESPFLFIASVSQSDVCAKLNELPSEWAYHTAWGDEWSVWFVGKNGKSSISGSMKFILMLAGEYWEDTNATE